MNEGDFQIHQKFACTSDRVMTVVMNSKGVSFPFSALDLLNTCMASLPIASSATARLFGGKSMLTNSYS